MVYTNIDVTTDAGTLDDLREAIRIRADAMKESASNATVAAAITILRSLKASTVAAPKDVTSDMFKIVPTDMFGGICTERGSSRRKICARVGSHFGAKSHIRPAIGFAPGGNAVMRTRVFAVYTTNPNDRFAQNVNAPARCWYVLCEHEGQAADYAERHIRRLLRKESGMAKYTLAIAQAQASTRSPIVPKEKAVNGGTMSPRAAGIAYGASEIKISDSGFANGDISVSFFDALRYSEDAAGGASALADAVGKATRSMIGYVEKKTGQYFERFHSVNVPNVQTPWSFA